MIDGGDKCHMTEWTSRPENRMVPILIPNIGFKEFGEIKPNAGILKSVITILVTLDVDVIQ